MKRQLANSPTLTMLGRIQEVHAFFRARSRAQMLVTAAPLNTPWPTAGLRPQVVEGRLACELAQVKRRDRSPSVPTQDPGNCLIDHAGPAGGRGEWERLGQRSGVAAPEGLQSAGVGATRAVVREVSSQVCSTGWSRFRVSRACVTESVSPAWRRRCSSAWRSLRESHQRFVESGPGGS
jgi:hypothetical protein